MSKRRKVFMDLEFTGLHQRTTPISIGMISSLHSFYAEFTDFETRQVNKWLLDNVLSKTAIFKSGVGLPMVEEDCMIEDEGRRWNVTGPSDYVARKLAEWLKLVASTVDCGQVEIWSDCYAYDWVVFCQLYKGAMNIPECVYYIPFDISTLMRYSGLDPDLSREQLAFLGEEIPEDAEKHNALWDAMVIQRCYEALTNTMGLVVNHSSVAQFLENKS